MSKIKTSFAVITVILLFAHPSMAGAEDLLDKPLLISPSHSFGAAEIPVQEWRWATAGPGLNPAGAAASAPGQGLFTADSRFLASFLPQGIGVHSSPGDSLFMGRSIEDMLRGEPEETACVVGFRYTFSDFDVSHFCKSLFNLFARGNRPPNREEPGFSFYMDSPSR